MPKPDTRSRHKACFSECQAFTGLEKVITACDIYEFYKTFLIVNGNYLFEKQNNGSFLYFFKCTVFRSVTFHFSFTQLNIAQLTSVRKRKQTNLVPRVLVTLVQRRNGQSPRILDTRSRHKACFSECQAFTGLEKVITACDIYKFYNTFVMTKGSSIGFRTSEDYLKFFSNVPLIFSFAQLNIAHRNDENCQVYVINGNKQTFNLAPRLERLWERGRFS